MSQPPATPAPPDVTPVQARATFLAVVFASYGGTQPDDALRAMFLSLAAAVAEHASPCEATTQIRGAVSADWLDEWHAVAARLLGLDPAPELPPLPRIRELLRGVLQLETAEAVHGDPIAAAMGDAIRYALVRCP